MSLRAPLCPVGGLACRSTRCRLLDMRTDLASLSGAASANPCTPMAESFSAAGDTRCAVVRVAGESALRRSSESMSAPEEADWSASGSRQHAQTSTSARRFRALLREVTWRVAGRPSASDASSELESARLACAAARALSEGLRMRRPRPEFDTSSCAGKTSARPNTDEVRGTFP